ncbi:MAG TPA: PIG-L family deacetylase [Anaerolineae bacterium]|nr:PIG-L family deacetylase [Anaerolineae bacterium]
MSAPAIFLSPHLDDAVLSCGGLIRRQVLSGTPVLVVTVFAGEPQHLELSPYATQIHSRWGNATHPTTVRREEDRRAMDLLGADYLHLPYVDAIYRFHDGSFLYSSDQELFGPIHPSEARLVSRLAAMVAGLHTSQDVTVYAPLAVGNHVDHQLVRDSLLSLQARFSQIVFYEDYPYVDRPGALTDALTTLGTQDWESELQLLDEECLKAKIEAIAAYQSQMATLFDSDNTMALRVREYSRAVSPNQGFAERCWRTRGRRECSQGRTRTGLEQGRVV